ncbi:Arginine--tRNA ligase [Streptomyces sp. RB17]|uniref:ArgS-related anticodon-binding protein NrtL n=1 Tax=Streptomyces sp. RB17 TaxID=2585197 RepID=UPI00130ADB4A|nr:DALR anticodon-binding domain-containing protein [Streptomyces sp. RB17]MQY40042.1 Arginine--tRNA ligase [Streptomyces sp. RB17]
MTPVELSRTVLHAVRCAVDDGELSVTVPERVVVTEPGPGGCGDFATNVALQLARPAGQPPRRVAEILRPRLVGADGIRDVVVTGPGFLNISLDAQADPVTGLVREIRERGVSYGHGDALAGQVVALRVPYEVRAEVVADAVVRIVATQGGRATVEHGEPVNLRPVPAPEDPAPLGHDASQWALLHPAPHDRPRITADHLVQRESNPLFRVRYAHARIRSLSRNAARLGFAAEPGPLDTRPDDTVPDETAPADSGLVHADPLGAAPADTGLPYASLLDSGLHGVGAPGTGLFEAAPVDIGPLVAGPIGTGLPHPHPCPVGPLDPAPLAGPPGAGPLDARRPHTAPVTTANGATANGTSAIPTSTTPRDLLTPLADHPRILAAAATHRAPDRIARHLVTVADAVLPFLPCVLPCGEEKPSAAHRARLALAEAAGTVLAGGLSLLGIDAPEHL